jgi:hypothetical protein
LSQREEAGIFLLTEIADTRRGKIKRLANFILDGLLRGDWRLNRKKREFDIVSGWKPVGQSRKLRMKSIAF